MKKIDEYIEEVLKNIDCTNEEKEDMYLEFHDHLNELKNEYIRNGKSPDEATKFAMIDFGDKKIVCEEMNKSVSRLKGALNHFFKVSWWIYSFAFVILLLRPFAMYRYPSRSTSLIPFKTILTYLTGTTYNVSYQILRNILGNILLFVPFTLLLPICFAKGRTFKESIIYTFLLSLLVELYQFIFKVGILDIDDVILNVLGGAIGYMLYKIMMIWLQKREKSYLVL